MEIAPRSRDFVIISYPIELVVSSYRLASAPAVKRADLTFV